MRTTNNKPLPTSPSQGRSNNFPLIRGIKGVSAFTLTELIVVITILVILGTIALMSFFSYALSARDSVRVSDITNISKGLDILIIRNGTVPPPSDNTITLSASGVIIGYQGYAGATVLSTIKMSEAKDPTDSKYYTYSTNFARTKYQLLSLLEDPNTKTSHLIDQAYAGYETRVPATKGDQLGILLSNTGTSLNQPVQELYNAVSFTGVDVVNTSTGYTAMIDNTNQITGTGSKLFLLTAIYPSKNPTSILISKDDTSLVGYWDMETVVGGKMLDLSGNGNNGTGYEGVTIGGINGVNGKATSFDGVNDSINCGNGQNFNTFSEITLVTWVKLDYNDGNWTSIISKNPKKGFFIMQRDDSTSLSFGMNYTGIGDGYAEATIATSIVNTDQWYCIAASYKSGEQKIYLNGILKNSGTEPTGNINLTDSNDLLIGSSFTGSQRFPGSIDEVRIYNRALSDSEISALYNATK